MPDTALPGEILTKLTARVAAVCVPVTVIDMVVEAGDTSARSCAAEAPIQT
jgi:hypothetical protein